MTVNGYDVLLMANRDYANGEKVLLTVNQTVIKTSVLANHQ
jgi:hypothetical protein